MTLQIQNRYVICCDTVSHVKGHLVSVASYNDSSAAKMSV